jgi:hypothetical protein
MRLRARADRREARRSRSRAAVVVALVAAAGCSGNTHPATSSAGEAAAGAPQPTRAPYLRMVDADNGWAVWPTGGSWLVLRTTDGWQHVQNATPAAVPTGGGLALGIAPDGGAAVAVEPYERLLTSPLLVRTGPATQWSPAELPGPVADSRQAVALSPNGTTVVLAGGTVVGSDNKGWRTITAATRLAPAGQLRLDAVAWADGSLGWLTGHGVKGAPVAVQTTDGGRSWTPLDALIGSAVAALAPCGSGRSWLLPVIAADHRITVERTTDGGASWSAGGSFAGPSAVPVWGCQGAEVWMLDHAGHVLASADSGATWSDRGKAPAGLTDLAPTSTDAGFAASGDARHPQLWAVSQGGADFARVALPAWVSALGAGQSTS